MNLRLNNAKCGIMLPQAGRLGGRPSSVGHEKLAKRL
jgi:ubiquinone/menaquinone biosynthesis C-methylase UbiE